MGNERSGVAVTAESCACLRPLHTPGWRIAISIAPALGVANCRCFEVYTECFQLKSALRWDSIQDSAKDLKIAASSLRRMLLLLTR